MELKNPNAPATARQLWRLHELTKEDTRNLQITMQEASSRISMLESGTSNQFPAQPIVDDENPFTEAHVTIIEGDQRSGKSCLAVGKMKDAYDCDCVRLFCRKYLGMDVIAKAYDRNSRIAKIKVGHKTQLIRIPNHIPMPTPPPVPMPNPTLSKMKIFSNIHLYGLPYVYIPSFADLLSWLQNGFISLGWLLIDEAHKGMSARAGMTSQGKQLVAEYFQFGKSQLEVIVITHNARLIDWTARTVPTQRIHTTYNEITKEITYTLKKKGEPGNKEITIDATQYWPYYRTNEKVIA